MSQQSLKDLLGFSPESQKAFDDAEAGAVAGSAWDCNIPETLEYRLLVDKSVLSKSGAGREQITITYEVVEPVEYAGSKFQDYIALKPNNTIGHEVFGKHMAALGASFDFPTGEAFAEQFEGKTVIAAIRKWGDADDRTGIRWLNADRGQRLKTDVKPKGKPKGSSDSLRPDLVIPKDEPFPESAPAQAAEAPKTAGSALPSAANLPPGLR